jgi:hypothetical protein
MFIPSKNEYIANKILPGDSRDIQHQVEIPSHKTLSRAYQQLWTEAIEGL